jgi:hypothetical protein
VTCRSGSRPVTSLPDTFVLNLKTAKAPGLDIPTNFPVLTDEVIK